MHFTSRRLSRLLTTVLFSTSPSKRMKSMVLLEIRRAENCSGATMAFTLSITSQLEMLLPGSLSCGKATLMVILAMGLRYRLYSEERHTASVVSWTMVVIVAAIWRSCRKVGETVKTVSTSHVSCSWNNYPELVNYLALSLSNIINKNCYATGKTHGGDLNAKLHSTFWKFSVVAIEIESNSCYLIVDWKTQVSHKMNYKHKKNI